MTDVSRVPGVSWGCLSFRELKQLKASLRPHCEQGSGYSRDSCMEGWTSTPNLSFTLVTPFTLEAQPGAHFIIKDG